MDLSSHERLSPTSWMTLSNFLKNQNKHYLPHYWHYGIININESSLCRIRLPLLKLPVIFGLLAYIYVWLSIRCLAGCPTDITNPIATQLSLLLNILQFIKVKVTPTKPVVQTENLGVTFNSLLWTLLTFSASIYLIVHWIFLSLFLLLLTLLWLSFLPGFFMILKQYSFTFQLKQFKMPSGS